MRNKINLEDLIHDEHVFRKIKAILAEHATFLKNVGEIMHSVAIALPEVFRINPAPRVKELKSIVDKLNKKPEEIKAEWKDFFDGLNTLEDIAGIRLVIATKDQYFEAEEILRKALKKLGEIVKKKNWGSDSEMDDTGYSADHYIIKKNGNESIICEIQIRTLTQDLWATFCHYESYKKENEEDNENKKTKIKELKNLARLMDVSDYYAQLIRNKKIQEANSFHCTKSNEHGIKHDLINFEFLITRFYPENYFSHSEMPDIKIDKIDIFKICDILKNLSTYFIFTKDEIDKVINNKTFRDYINTSFKEIQLKENIDTEMHSIDELGILCECHRMYRKDFAEQNLTDRAKKLIKAMVEIWKDELAVKIMLEDVYSNLNDQKSHQ